MQDPIEKFPALKRQMQAELGMLGSNCPACQRRKVISKYQKLAREKERLENLRAAKIKREQK